MNYFVKSVAACCAAALLASCGGEESSRASTPAPPVQLATMSKFSAQTVADYTDVIQRVYVSYFGRPADPAGLAYFANLYLNNNAATTILGLSNSYGTNPVITELINNFGVSEESKALYPGDNTSFVTAIYRNLFSREPDIAGRDYWVDALNRNNVTRAQAAVTIMGAAQGEDAVLITAKIAAATAFTNALNSTKRTASYDGLAANVVARNALGGITAATPPANVPGIMEGAINTLTTQFFAPVGQIIQARCAGCHSAQPTIAGFNPAPLGIKYDTEAQVYEDAARINSAAVLRKSMPYANATKMTDAERAVIGAWYKKVFP